MEMSEKDIENSILEYLASINVFAWKNQTVGIFDPVKKIYRRSNNRYHINGVADILGIYKGRMLAIEVKTPTNKNGATEAQKAFINKVNKEGGIAFVATSIQNVMENLNLHSPLYKT